MTYLECCINEALRMYGPGNLLFPRKTSDADFILDGCKIPKDILIAPTSISIHFDEKLYPNPNEFLPERWMQEETGKPPFSFVAFGGGAKNCLGQHLAKIEAKIIASRMIDSFDFSAESPLKMILKMGYIPKYSNFLLKNKI